MALRNSKCLIPGNISRGNNVGRKTSRAPEIEKIPSFTISQAFRGKGPTSLLPVGYK